MLSFGRDPQFSAEVYPVRNDCKDVRGTLIKLGDLVVENSENGRYGKVVGFTNIIRSAGEIINSPTAIRGNSGESEPIFMKQCYVICHFVQDEGRVIRLVKDSSELIVFSPKEAQKNLARWLPLVPDAAITVGDSLGGIDPGNIPGVVEIYFYSLELLDKERDELRKNSRRKPDVLSYIAAISEKAQQISKKVKPQEREIFESKVEELLNEPSLHKSTWPFIKKSGGARRKRSIRRRSKKSSRRTRHKAARL